jgi:DNA polymerase-3 subunit delta'
MKLADVVGHERAVERLRRAAASGRVAGSYLLIGPAGIGKRLLADAFAARLLCAEPVGDDACGVCAHCTRLAAGSHPDLHLVERDEERRDIRIEQVRELGRWLALHPLMATRKVAIVDGAHCLSEPAQNALLKTLEEPPRSSVLVLTATAPALLLPTVRSRCQPVRLDPLPAATVTEVLVAKGIPPKQAAGLAAQAEGSPGRALSLGGEDETKAREAMLELLARLATADAAALSGLAQTVARGAVDAALAAAAAWYRDVLETALAGDVALRNFERADAVRAAAAATSPRRALRQLEVVCDTLDAVARNANRVLAVETMLLELRALARESRTAAPVY